MTDIKSVNMKEEIINAFFNEFGFIKDKFEILDLLGNGVPMDHETIKSLKLPSKDYDIVWHPGVYAFIGNDQLYRVGVSMINSRHRVMQHLIEETSKNGYSIWDIEKFEDKSILLINVKEKKDRHWLLAIEAFFEVYIFS